MESKVFFLIGIIFSWERWPAIMKEVKNLTNKNHEIFKILFLRYSILICSKNWTEALTLAQVSLKLCFSLSEF